MAGKKKHPAKSAGTPEANGSARSRTLAAQRAAPLPPRRTCGTMASHMLLLETNPSFRDRLVKLEQETADYRGTGLKIADVPIAAIRVVVNVVYNDPTQNIPDAQIKTQIAALNKDYRRTNPDRSKTPSVFAGLVSDSRIQFVLDRITRTKTTKLSFLDDNGVKKAGTGGKPPVDTTKFLNVWVCALGGGLLGYAQFPGGPAATDGVVIHYRAFGTSGTAQAPYDKGRSATHEIGHYFNLRHIWGDTPDCSGSDAVADTPNAAGPNFGKPKFPTVTCNNGPNGDMFMNYMDYTDDAAMFMFTTQQVARMRATLDGPRRSLW
jgi:Pregnancy-associated plasma protein-A